MSPEQARGRPADKRSDIWAFGCVLFEMLTGKRAFDGEDVSVTLAFILTKSPAWDALPLATPAPIRKLLQRSLEKDRKRRLADVSDARLEIDEALASPATELSTASVIAKAPSHSGWHTALWALAAALGGPGGRSGHVDAARTSAPTRTAGEPDAGRRRSRWERDFYGGRGHHARRQPRDLRHRVPRQLTKRKRPTVPHAFTPDGTQLLFITPVNPPYDIGVVNLTGDRHLDLLLHGPQSETNPEISPDGKWLAYESDESGVPEIYVRPFPNIEAGRWQISSGGGSRPLWARSGRELFYESPEPIGARTLKIWAVSVEGGATFTNGMPQQVVDAPYLSPQSGRSYDVSADGKKFVMIKNATPAPASGAVARPSQVVVVMNWQEELKQRVPVK